MFSGGGSNSDGPNLAAQFEKWGWIPFLNYVAKEAAIFYKNNGKSNLDNVKETKAYDVLIWASVQSDEAQIMKEYYDSLKTN